MINTDEKERVEYLEKLGILDTNVESSFDRITQLASRVFDMPIALVSLVDDKRQWFKSKVGVDVRETPREWSVCQYVVSEAQPLVIHDMRKDKRICQSPLVKDEPHAVFYAGYPLIVADGFCLGSFCVIDTHPRTWSDDDAKSLKDFAEIVIREIELHKQLLEALSLLHHKL